MISETLFTQRVEKTSYRTSVRAILINTKGQVLLGKRNYRDPSDPGKLCIPGGKISHKEGPTNALLREIKEETNLTLPASGLKMLGTVYGGSNGKSGKTLYFEVLIKDDSEMEIKYEEGESFEELRWFDYDELKDVELAFDHREILSQYFQAKMRSQA